MGLIQLNRHDKYSQPLTKSNNQKKNQPYGFLNKGVNSGVTAIRSVVQRYSIIQHPTLLHASRDGQYAFRLSESEHTVLSHGPFT